jgi:hypothetical protein
MKIFITIISILFFCTSCIKEIKSGSASKRISNSEANTDQLFNELNN